jgi:hypothetical protein
MSQSITVTCECSKPFPSEVGMTGRFYCLVCGKDSRPENDAGSSKSRATMPADVQREIARLRRIVNESLDRIQELMRAA